MAAARFCIACLLPCLVAACAPLGIAPPPPGSIALPLRLGWFEGREVRYVTTDISDRAIASEQGANHVPGLAVAIGGQGSRALTSRVYKVVNHDQRPVFQSSPIPVGPANAATGYSPLWRLVKVEWKAGATRRELRSEEAILAAEDKGELSIQPTGVVLNCPVLEVVGIGRLPGVQ